MGRVSPGGAWRRAGPSVYVMGGGVYKQRSGCSSVPVQKSIKGVFVSLIGLPALEEERLPSEVHVTSSWPYFTSYPKFNKPSG